MPRKATVPPLTSGQAKFVLTHLIDEGKVTAADIRNALGHMWNEMSAMEKRLEELRAAVEPARHPIRGARRATSRVKRAMRKALSPERRESMRLQGRYLGLLRKSAKSARAGFKKLARERGRTEAIAAMEKALARS